MSTAAARYQQLALNPQKLAGQCGKLKCCLNYELDTYLDALKDFPPTDSKLLTEKGLAFCQKTDIFKGEDPIDKDIAIWGINFKVVGVYTDPGGEREESNVYLPLTTVQNAFNGGDNIRDMAFTVKMSNSFKEALTNTGEVDNSASILKNRQELRRQCKMT